LLNEEIGTLAINQTYLNTELTESGGSL